MGHGIWPRLSADGAEGDVIIETLTDKQKLTLVLTVRELSPFRLPEGWEGFAEKGGGDVGERAEGDEGEIGRAHV